VFLDTRPRVALSPRVYFLTTKPDTNRFCRQLVELICRQQSRASQVRLAGLQRKQRGRPASMPERRCRRPSLKRVWPTYLRLSAL
jgi:hypothetical protein